MEHRKENGLTERKGERREEARMWRGVEEAHHAFNESPTDESITDRVRTRVNYPA